MSSKSIDIKDVEHMANLARLEISSERSKLFASQFGNILSYMDALSLVETKDVEPLYSPITFDATLREDVTTNKADRSEVLSNSPKADEQYFVVPRIV